MIVRGFYMARTHLVEHVVQWEMRRYDGCVFESPVGSILRTKCDQFLMNDTTPMVLIRDVDTPTCAECREKLRIEAVAAAASAE